MYRGTILQVLDNSGGLTAEIIRVFKSTYEHPKVGSTVVVAIKNAILDKKVKKHDVKRGVIIQSKQRIYRKELGITLHFHKNGLILYGRGNNPIATRIKGVVPQELRYQKMVKLLMMAPSVI